MFPRGCANLEQTTVLGCVANHDADHALFSPLFPQGTILIGRREGEGEGAGEGAAVVRQINLQIKGATYHLICKLICRLIFI